MDVHLQIHLSALRDLLAFRLEELGAGVHAADLARRFPSTIDLSEPASRGDEAARQRRASAEEAQEQRDREELARVAAALKRIDAGTYGGCVECDEPIAPERLLDQPDALRCAPCQAEHEHLLSRLIQQEAPTAE